MGGSIPSLESAGWKKGTKNSDSYFLSRPGSVCSPAVLSPEPDERPSLLRRRQNAASASGGILPSVPGCVPIEKISDALPVTSPPNDLSSEQKLLGDSIFQTSFELETGDLEVVDRQKPQVPTSNPGQIHPKADPLLVHVFKDLGIDLPAADHSDICRDSLRSFGLLETASNSDMPGNQQQLSSDPDSQVGGGNQPELNILPGSSSQSHRTVLRQNVGIITPPADCDSITRGDSKISNQRPSTPVFNLQQPDSGVIGDQHTPADEATSAVAVATGGEDSKNWLQPALVCVVSSMDVSSLSGNMLRILSQALPLPSIPGNVFPILINSVRLSLPPSPLMWINVMHAIPSWLSLSDIPSSRPTTPRQPVGVDDYFPTRAFSSALPAVDYEADVVPATPDPSSNALAPPGSINVAMVERYIPPASPKELADLFTVQASSLLVDRMVELSPTNGCLVFIYPTRRGGQTFESQYLGPVLDPLLRSMVVTHGLSSGFSTSLGTMSSVGALHSFEAMKRRTECLCETLNGDMPSSAERLQGVQSSFSLAHSSKQQVSLDRKVWSDWWIRQEKPRIRKAVLDYFRTSKQLPVVEAGKPEIHQGSFVQSVLDGVANRPPRVQPSDKIEVGVFVIKRSDSKTSP